MKDNSGKLVGIRDRGQQSRGRVAQRYSAQTVVAQICAPTFRMGPQTCPLLSVQWVLWDIFFCCRKLSFEVVDSILLRQSSPITNIADQDCPSHRRPFLSLELCLLSV
jgi:hypothetical protein